MNPLTIAGAAVLGWFLGVLVNYLSDVLPNTRRFTPPLCDDCHLRRSFLDLVFIRLCSRCEKRRSLRTWIVQISAAAVTALLWVFPPARVGFWVGTVLVTFFAVVVVIDIEHKIIMHPVSLTGAVLGGAVGVWRHGWVDTLLGGLAGFGIMLALYYFGYLFAKGLSKLRKESFDDEALGFGDVNLSGVMGLILGWPGVMVGLVTAILLGGIGGLAVLVTQVARRKYQAFQAIPYGPFLALAALITLFWR